MPELDGNVIKMIYLNRFFVARIQNRVYKASSSDHDDRSEWVYTCFNAIHEKPRCLTRRSEVILEDYHG